MQFGQYEQAQTFLGEGLQIAQTIRYERLITLLTIARGNLESLQGNFEQAEQIYAEAQTRAQTFQQTYDLCFTLNCMGVHFWLKQDWDSAMTYLSQSTELSQRYSFFELNGFSKFHLSMALAKKADRNQAVLIAQESLKTFEEIGYWRRFEVGQWLTKLTSE